jgi:NADP-dependent 3-hydroxy acid dehydrogenase YdfG
MKALSDARVLVTGASSGIGAAAARAFAEAGARLHLVARRADLLAEVAEQCRQLGAPEAHAHALDVRDRAGVFALAEDLEARGGCDVAIANAGVMQLGPLLDMPFEDIARQIDVNLYGVVHVLQAFGRPMRARGAGVLMPVSSVVAVQTLPHYAAYCASKSTRCAWSCAAAASTSSTSCPAPPPASCTPTCPPAPCPPRHARPSGCPPSRWRG